MGKNHAPSLSTDVAVGKSSISATMLLRLLDGPPMPCSVSLLGVKLRGEGRRLGLGRGTLPDPDSFCGGDVGEMEDMGDMRPGLAAGGTERMLSDHCDEVKSEDTEGALALLLESCRSRLSPSRCRYGKRDGSPEESESGEWAMPAWSS